jgi:hypothetical protein
MNQRTFDFDNVSISVRVDDTDHGSSQETELEDSLPPQGVPDKLSAGQARRDEALQRVTSHAGEDWQQQAMRVFAKLPPGSELIGEDIRRLCAAEGIRPHHPNAWGPFVNQLIRTGRIVATGQGPMRDPRSHARKTTVYRKK